MNKYRTYQGQKAGLARAINSGSKERVLLECQRVVNRDWTPNSPFSPYWPDEWRRWLRALEDIYRPELPPDNPFEGCR